MKGHNAMENLVDVVSLVTVLGVLNQILPPIAAILAIIWTLIRIVDYFYMLFTKNRKAKPLDE